VSTPIAVQVARLSRRGLCAAVALALSLACSVFAVAASTTPMPGMVDMAAVGSFTNGLTDGGVDDVVREADSPGASVMSLPMGSMCNSACVTDVIEMCTVAGALTLITMLALLAASRRDTFMGLPARAHPCALRRRRQRPWTVLSPIFLCVLRV